MAIDFRDPALRRTYTGREPGPEWAPAVTALLDPAGRRVGDLGCGGGVYSRAWRTLGAAVVVGVDSSPVMIAGAREAGEVTGVRHVVAEATATGLAEGCLDVVFARALVHHLPDPAPLLAEAHRLLRPGGHVLLQDRTVADVDAPASAEHVRALLFEAAPGLRTVEVARRPADHAVRTALDVAGFTATSSRTLWETRRVHPDAGALAADLRARTGRSILHELDDDELEDVVTHVLARVGAGPVVERDRWTLWHGVRPA